MTAITVGDLRKLLDTLPDSAPIRPVWLDPSVIDDACPAVTLCGFERLGLHEDAYLAVKVDLSYPTDEDESYADGNDNDYAKTEAVADQVAQGGWLRLVCLRPLRRLHQRAL